MLIKRSTIERYLELVASYIGVNGSLPDDVTEYRDYVISMKNRAIKEGELDILLLGIDCLLIDSNLNAPSFTEVFYLFDPDEMEEFLKYIRFVAFPDAPPLNPETIENVKIV
jgi:hypothetical protein